MTTTAEPGTDLARYEEAAPPALRVPALPSLPDVDSWIRAMASIAKLADKICDTEFVPAALRGKPDAVTAAILTGRELDMPPMLALRTINMIKGVPSLSAEFKRAKVLAAGHMLRILEWDEQHCKIAARRKGDRGEPTVIEYTMAHARKAGLIRKNKDGSPGKYETDPMPMMLARATSRAANALFADVTNGLATTDLLDDPDALADAIGASLELPAIAPPPVEDLRQRAAAQTVTATVVTPEPSPAGTESPSSAPPASPVADVPPAGEARSYAQDKELIQAKLAQLGVDAEGQLRVTARLARRTSLKSFDSLPPAQAAAVASAIEHLTENTELAALLDDAEVPGE